MFYGVKYRLTSDTGDINWILVPGGIPDTFHTFIGLSPLIGYTFAVASVCYDTIPSGWVKVADSNAVCEPPLNLQDTIILDNMTLGFSWVTCWQSPYNQMRYRSISEPDWNYIFTGTAQSATIYLPANGTVLFQAASCPDTTGSWSVTDTILINLPPSKPNQIVILLDDIRYDSYSCNGAPAFFQTPNIDRIANEGVNFKNSFVVFSLCNPSRASILTGLYANHSGALNNKSMPYSFLPTIGTIMDKAGYYTAFLGKYLNANEDDPVPQPGWDYWMARIGSGHINADFNYNGIVEKDIRGHVADVLTDSAVAIINRTHQPFLIYICYTTHPAWVPRRQDSRLFQNADIPLPSNYYPYQVNFPSFLSHSIYAAEDSEALLTNMKHYYQVVEGIDEEVARIFGALEGKNILDSTLILFTSDNGYLMGEHYLEGKRLPYEESMRVPMFIRYPKWFPANSVITNQMVANIDIASTLFELAGVDTIPTDGLSMHKIFDGDTSRTEFYYQATHLNDSADNSRSVRSFAYKYNYYYCDHNTDEFFDLINDPHENTNLINNVSYQDLIQEYRSKMDSFKIVFGDNLIEEIRPCALSNAVFINDTVIILPEDSLLFYPNPSAGNLQIEFPPYENNETVDILIYNMDGVAVFQSKKTLISGGNTFHLDVNDLFNGIYDIQFRLDKKIIRSKLVIIR